MVIYLFRDETDNENFALSVDVTGANIPPVTPRTEWIFVEALDTLSFVEPWDIEGVELAGIEEAAKEAARRGRDISAREALNGVPPWCRWRLDPSGSLK